MSTQTTIDLGIERQSELGFPLTLVEKYQPRISDYVGLIEPKRTLMDLLRSPRACNYLLVGDPGTGKTTMVMRFAEQLPGTHHHIPAAQCDLAELEKLWYRFHLFPSVGNWHILHVSEADTMTAKAQEHLLSWMDGTACLKPVWGGGSVRGTPPPVMHFFTANVRRVGGEMRPPAELLPRFVSRCQLLYLTSESPKVMGAYLKKIWKAEKGLRGMPDGFFEWLAEGVGMRDALNRMESELMRKRSVAQVVRQLAELADRHIIKLAPAGVALEDVTEWLYVSGLDYKGSEIDNFEHSTERDDALRLTRSRLDAAVKAVRGGEYIPVVERAA